MARDIFPLKRFTVPRVFKSNTATGRSRIIIRCCAVLVENAGFPVPGEMTLLAAGFFASQGHFALPVVMGVAALGAIVGDNAGYWMGRRPRGPFLERYGPYVWLSPARPTTLEAFFSPHWAKTIAIAPVISGLRVLAAFSAR